MRYISLISLFVGLNDLLGKRVGALSSFAAGAASIKLLTSKRDALAKLPAVTEGRPLVGELDAADTRHDALGYALWHFLESYLVHPDTSVELREGARKIRSVLIPTLGDLVASYPAEARAAMERKAQLPALESTLVMFPVAGGGTLRDWAESFLVAGEKIDSLLSARADLESQSRKDAARLRGEVIGLLNRMRKNLALEMKDDPSLPADLDAKVFGYFDLLEKTSAEAQAKGKPVEEVPPPPANPV
ncbi:hypothetical protein [Polyangium aurulentum]|uniref:hypothetical protein n=1 Tax=Polyangium aurulentum TaxID=2567896 RepID=UPI0010AE73DF|nr:hypothetical protein [Polyangium aurulentum]UQA61931.1 hypothetical protein E8A73_016250 [Polyangium aurulentum]